MYHIIHIMSYGNQRHCPVGFIKIQICIAAILGKAFFNCFFYSFLRFSYAL